MTETKFTPGPWSVPKKYISEVEHSSGSTIATCWHELCANQTIDVTDIYECSLEESAANAHLIAAAPELYEALEKAKAAMQPFDHRVFYDNGDVTVTDVHTLTIDEWADLYFAVRNAFDALAKARGES